MTDLVVTNPSTNMKHGAVSVPLSEVYTQAPRTAAHLVLTRGNDVVRSQIDEVDPNDSARTVLSAYAHHVEASNLPNVYFRVAYRDDPPKVEKGPTVEARNNNTEFLLRGEHLAAFVFLPAGPLEWQGGAITSVRLYNFEMLDAFTADSGDWQNHDREKRLQLDQVAIANAPWNPYSAVRKALYKQDWTYVAHGSGPVRAFVTIKSSPFKYVHDGTELDNAEPSRDPKDPKPPATDPAVTYDCNLYRVISLYYDADYLVEDLYLKGTRRSDNAVRQFAFAPHYFLKMHVGAPPPIRRAPQIPDWFAIGATKRPYPGFGFAATVPCSRIDNPPGDYPNEAQKHSAFAWELGFAREVRCLSLFRGWIQPHEISDETGRYWYNYIYKPLIARVQPSAQEHHR